MNYEKPAKWNPTFLQDKVFSIVLKYWQVSKYTAMLSEFTFPKKEKKKSNFQMVNLRNGETKDFAELWAIITFEHLNLKHYSQTCSNDHLCQMTTAKSAQANSHSIAFYLM